MKTTVNLEEELTLVSDSNKKQIEKILTESGLSEVKGLLGYQETRDKQILQMIGGNSVNTAIHNIQGAAIQLEKEEDYYGSRVFTNDQIKTLCGKYRLKFLPSSNFIGSFGIEVAAKIKEMEKKICESRDADRAKRENCTVEELRAKESYVPFKFDDHQLKNDFSIMAPPSMFNLSVRPKPEKIREIRSYDPVLFFKANDKWAMVYKWGNDFSVLRAIKGFVYKNESTMLFTTFLIVASLLFLGLSTFTNIFINGNLNYNILAVVAVLLVSPLLSILVLPKSGSDVYSDSGWNTPFKS